ncbi:gamma-1-syntrophin-like isoform X2 [Dinothrombium tinctorium]|uniref:Gamma-1-syntrophin-like isoform X2 n=1 Tax=Dinothrombium tinctorium TaxID=1965070 RepID=A0A3S3P0Z9_9ACAR|nr:gamma-1-syntrophin-like isoform X2 [Dinothrombium tinctorium]RWS09879.1 gamma-1-syntrophin-like isoform X2 [Dinothrombium tinctorium]RWS10061.1 gamma-1-syntrophin-like isoform X2 [Dinothrombium tinctorium]
MSISESKTTVSTESSESAESSSKQRLGSKLGMVTVCDNFVRNGSKSGLSARPEPMRLRLTPEKLILQKEVAESEALSIDSPNWLFESSSESSSGAENLSDFREVKLVKDKTGLGINIKGGSEHGLPILISSLVKNSPADRSGQLFIGDAIIKVNEIPLSLSTHDQAIKILKSAGSRVTLTVKHFKTASPFLNKCWKKKEEWRLPRINNNKKENSKTTDKRVLTTKWIDVISVDLLCCHVTKYIHDTDKVRPNGFEIRWCLPHSDSDNSSVESLTNSISQKRKSLSSAIVTCNDSIIYSEWRTEIDNYVNKLNSNYLKALNEKLAKTEQILFMGWVSQGYPSSKQEPHRPCYRWTTKYLVIKGGELYIYNNAGHFLKYFNGEAGHGDDERLSSYIAVYRCYQSVLRCLKTNELVDERENCFILLTANGHNQLGTSNVCKFGPSSIAYLSVETGHDLMKIKNAWNKATYYSVTQLGVRNKLNKGAFNYKHLKLTFIPCRVKLLLSLPKESPEA